jgi:hypothetical protein
MESLKQYFDFFPFVSRYIKVGSYQLVKPRLKSKHFTSLLDITLNTILVIIVRRFYNEYFVSMYGGGRSDVTQEMRYIRYVTCTAAMSRRRRGTFVT